MTDENPIINHLLQVNWPLSDPAWDYATIYERCQLAQSSLEKLIAYIMEFDQSSPESDRVIRENLDQIGQHLNQTRRLLDE